MRTETSKAENIQHIWVVTGPAGCGKSTVGRMLQKELGLPFLEGDDVSAFHTPDIVSMVFGKMRKSN
jgi:shikimate kinase